MLRRGKKSRSSCYDPRSCRGQSCSFGPHFKLLEAMSALAIYYWKASGTQVESYMILCGTESPLLDLVAWGGLFLCVQPQMLFTWLDFQQVPGLTVSLNTVSIMEFLAAPICLYPSKSFPLPHHTSDLLTTLNISHIAQTIMYLLLQIFSCMKIIADILLSNLRAEPHY